MLKTTFLSVILFCITFCYAQKKTPAGKMPSQKEIGAIKKQTQQMIGNLSPEDKKMMEEGMKMAQEMQKNGTLPTAGKQNITTLPVKQTALLAKIPVINSAAAFNAYIESLKAKASQTIDKKIRDEVEQTLIKYKSDAKAINNLGPALLIKKNVPGAIYAAIRAVQLNPAAVLSQNNLTVILHQSGYPQYALPILVWLNTQYKSDRLLNTSGQCYLSLGDKEKAKEFFIGALRLNPANADANCGMGLILTKEGKIGEAAPYIQKAMKDSYSETLEDLMDQHKISLDYSAIRAKVPEYFNELKIKPAPAATKLEEISPVITQRNELDLLREAWYTKSNASDEETNAKMENENMEQMVNRVYGYLPTAPFSRRARFMVIQSTKDFAARGMAVAIENEKARLQANEMLKQMDDRINKRFHDESFASTYEECVMQKEELQKYLKESAELYDGMVRKNLFKRYDYANDQLYWNLFLMNDEQYKNYFYRTATELVRDIAGYWQWQPLNTSPESIARRCEDILKNPPKDQAAEGDGDYDCPIKVKYPIGIGSIKEDCKGIEWEGGELLVLGYEKDYKSGEWTVAFGLGESTELGFLGLGVKGQMFFKLNGFQPIDCGMRFESGGEVNIGPVVIEEKVTAVIGMTSGINVDAVDNGKTTNIFNLDPTK